MCMCARVCVWVDGWASEAFIVTVWEAMIINQQGDRDRTKRGSVVCSERKGCRIKRLNQQQD